MAGDWPSVNGAGGNTSSAEAPPSAAMRAMRAASMLPSAHTPLMSGNRSPISACAMSSTRRCSSNVQEATSVECALMVTAERPGVAATSRRCLRKLASSMARSASKGSSTAGITPWGMYDLCRALLTSQPGDALWRPARARVKASCSGAVCDRRCSTGKTRRRLLDADGRYKLEKNSRNPQGSTRDGSHGSVRVMGGIHHV